MRQSRGRGALRVLILIGLAGCADSRGPVAPEPEPTPPPVTAAPQALGCGLPHGGGTNEGCGYEVATFVEAVDAAIAKAMREHPEAFDFTRCRADLSCRVMNHHFYMITVMRNLEERHLCAFGDPFGQEIGVKNNNAFSDQYAIITSDEYSRYGIGAYRATCHPAGF